MGTVGTTQYRGMAVPLRGETELIQITAATDFVTLTGAASISGDFIVCRDSTGATEYFLVTAAGAVTGLSDATFTSSVTCKNLTASTLITGSKDITATSTVTAATVAAATVTASKDVTATSSVTAATVTGSTLIAATKDLTVGSTATIVTVAGTTVNASTGGTAKDYTVTSTLTAGSFAGGLRFTSQPMIQNFRFSAPVTTALAATGLNQGALYLVMKSSTPQLCVQISSAANSLKYFTSNTATFGRASVT